jgi:hypothetical protein
MQYARDTTSTKESMDEVKDLVMKANSKREKKSE